MERVEKQTPIRVSVIKNMLLPPTNKCIIFTSNLSFHKLLCLYSEHAFFCDQHLNNLLKKSPSGIGRPNVKKHSKYVKILTSDFDPKLQIILASDTIGAVILHKHKDYFVKAIAHESRTLLSAENSSQLQIHSRSKVYPTDRSPRSMIYFRV